LEERHPAINLKKKKKERKKEEKISESLGKEAFTCGLKTGEEAVNKVL